MISYLKFLRVVVWDSVRLASLGAGSVAKARLFLFSVTSPLKKHFRWTRDRWVSVRLCANGTTLACELRNESDLYVLKQLFVDRKYRLPPTVQPAVIVDLGSHIGLSIIWFRLQFPDAAILGAEADPVAFAKLTENTRHLENVTIHNVALATVDGPVPFFSTYESWASSLTHASDGQDPVTVAGRTLDGLLAEAGVDRVDVIKVTLEGAEFEVLRTFSRLGQVQAVVGHPRPSRAGRSREEFFALLEGFRIETDWRGEGSLFKAYNARITG